MTCVFIFCKGGTCRFFTIRVFKVFKKNPILQNIRKSGFYGFYSFVARILPKQSLAQMAQMRNGLLWEYPTPRSPWSRVQVEHFPTLTASPLLSPILSSLIISNPI
jgi:hypothetical protein